MTEQTETQAQTPTAALEAKAQELAKSLKHIETVEALVEEAKNALQATQAYADLQDEEAILANSKKRASEVESALRDLIKEIYEETGDKSPYKGLGIRVYTNQKVNYDPDRMERWARREAPMLLTLDTKAVEDLAKTNPGKFPQGMVEVETEERVTPTVSKSTIREMAGDDDDQEAPF